MNAGQRILLALLLYFKIDIDKKLNDFSKQNQTLINSELF